jgi:hypothetical protein
MFRDLKNSLVRAEIIVFVGEICKKRTTKGGMETVHNKSSLGDGRCKSGCIIYILYQSMMRYRGALSFKFFLSS